MCDNKHEHWCSGCGKDLNKEPKDNYVEIEWSQSDRGEILYDKKMLCRACLEDMPNVKALNDFFSELKYQPWGHVFCSVCKRDITQELGKDIKPGIDYECLNFKEHKERKHFIKVVVLCKDCVQREFYVDNLEKLRKLGRNPVFRPKIECTNIEKCKQYKKGDDSANCKYIVIGRDRETLNLGLLCGRKHKGALLLPFDDGFTIARPRKIKGAAVANPPAMPAVPGVLGNPIKDSFKEMEKLLEKFLKKNKLGMFAEPTDDGRIIALEARLAKVERTLGIHDAVIVPASTKAETMM